MVFATSVVSGDVCEISSEALVSLSKCRHMILVILGDCRQFCETDRCAKRRFFQKTGLEIPDSMRIQKHSIVLSLGLPPLFLVAVKEADVCGFSASTRRSKLGSGWTRFP